jgi:hypothetical protein
LTVALPLEGALSPGELQVFPSSTTRSASQAERWAGWSTPRHRTKVRELVIDALSPAELCQLRAASERILERIETSAG